MDFLAAGEIAAWLTDWYLEYFRKAGGRASIRVERRDWAFCLRCRILGCNISRILYKIRHLAVGEKASYILSGFWLRGWQWLRGGLNETNDFTPGYLACTLRERTGGLILYFYLRQAFWALCELRMIHYRNLGRGGIVNWEWAMLSFPFRNLVQLSTRIFYQNGMDF